MSDPALTNASTNMPRHAPTRDRPDYVVIAGQGRSGTNWLLKLLDVSPHTFSRNEPNSATGSVTSRLPNPNVPTDGNAARLDAEWDAAARWTATHMGDRDHVLRWPKDYIYPVSRRLGLMRTVNRRPRRMLSWLAPDLKNGEWQLPYWLGSQKKVAEATAVLKFILAPVWAEWLLTRRPNVQVLHIVRHPGGYLNSWRNRWLSGQDAAEAHQWNRDRLNQIRQADPVWGDLFGDVDALPLEESELWYWRFATERIHRAGVGKPRYERIIYEHLAAEPLAVAERQFRLCGLPWDEQVAARVKGTTGESTSIAAAWRSKATDADLAAIERVLPGSLMADWWDEG
jgi:hypothetical protein